MCPKGSFTAEALCCRLRTPQTGFFLKYRNGRKKIFGNPVEPLAFRKSFLFSVAFFPVSSYNDNYWKFDLTEIMR